MGGFRSGNGRETPGLWAHVHPCLRQLDVETLLVWADNDPTVPVDWGRALLEMTPGAELQVPNPARHMVMADASEGFNRLVHRLR